MLLFPADIYSNNTAFMLWATDRGSYCKIQHSEPSVKGWAMIIDPPTFDYDIMRAKTIGTEIDGDKFLPYLDTVAGFAENMKDHAQRRGILLSDPQLPIFWNFSSMVGAEASIKCWDGLLGNMRFRIIKVHKRETFANSTLKYYAFVQDTDEGKTTLMRIRLMF